MRYAAARVARQVERAGDGERQARAEVKDVVDGLIRQLEQEARVDTAVASVLEAVLKRVERLAAVEVRGV